MSHSRIRPSGLLAALLLAASGLPLLPACSGGVMAEPTAAVPGKVTDVDRFQTFIATRPSPAEFRARYPDVQLVLPGTVTTKELRSDNSRFFAELDAEGRIARGNFR